MHLCVEWSVCVLALPSSQRRVRWRAHDTHSLSGNFACQEYSFTFKEEERAHKLYTELSEMCRRCDVLERSITARVHR
jgi:hypothetical protein